MAAVSRQSVLGGCILSKWKPSVRYRAPQIIAVALISGSLGYLLVSTLPSDWEWDARIATVAVAGIGLGGIGAVFRAAAHGQHEEYGWADYLGKLFAVSAFVLSMAGATASLPATVLPRVVPMLSIVGVVLLLALVGSLLYRWTGRRDG